MAREETDYIIIHCAATKPDMDIDAKDTGWLAGLADAFGHTALRFSHLE